jgi:hypothetical protein
MAARGIGLIFVILVVNGCLLPAFDKQEPGAGGAAPGSAGRGTGGTEPSTGGRGLANAAFRDRDHGGSGDSRAGSVNDGNGGSNGGIGNGRSDGGVGHGGSDGGNSGALPGKGLIRIGHGGVTETPGRGSSGAALPGGAAGTAGTGCNLPETKVEQRECGACGTGTQTRELMLTEACTYAEGTWSDCSGAVTDPCLADAEETDTQACGACNTGTQSRTRTCSGQTCTWGTWSAWSACSGVTAACAPGETTACSPSDACGHRVCSDSCQWGGCVPKKSGGCVLRRNGTQVEGSNYRCCGDGKWQYCLPETCQWSTDCDTCSAAYCEC